MKKIPKIVYLALAVLIAVGGILISTANRVMAIEPGMYAVEGNPTCASLNADPFFDNITSNFGFKIDGYIDNFTVPTGNLIFTLTAGTQHGYPTVLTGGAPSDPSNSITLIGNTEYLFSWAASMGIDAVIVKAQDANAFVYVPEAYAGTALYAPLNKEISHIEFCYDYELNATKTAAASYTRTYTWTIDKAANGDYDGFIGDPAFNHNYTVSVDRTVSDSAWAVSGEIVVNNPTPWTVDFSVSDMVGGTAATVDCGGVTSLAPGASVNCTYSASLAGPVNGTNTATVTSTTVNVGGATATAPYTFGEPTTVVGPATVNVTDSFEGALGPASGDFTFPTYDKSFQCPTDPAVYVDGVFNMTPFVNTATITQTGQSDSATVNLTCYAPVVSKTAAGAYTEDHEWSITKSVSPTPQNQFAGLGVEFTWTIDVVETISEYGFGVSGGITVQNPHPIMAMTVSLADVLSDDTAGLIGACTNGAAYANGSLTVPASTTTVCGYTAAPSRRTATLNTATATLNGIPFSYDAPIVWTPTVLDATVTIDDDQNPSGFPALIDTSTSFSYGDSYTCSSDASLYAGDGTYQHSEDNTAILATDNGATESSTATEVVNCYAPVVSKTAVGTYDETHTWDIEKTATPPVGGMPGDKLSWTWTVTLSETSADSNFAVEGMISVTNPAGSPGAMSVDLADILNDGTVAILGCDLPLSVPVGETATCAYTAVPTKAADRNTVTATFNEIDFTAFADFEWDVNVINGEAMVTDGQIGLNEPVTAGEGPWVWSDTQTHTCSSNKANYGTGTNPYVYGQKLTNTATVGWGETTFDSSYAETAYTCKAGFVDLLKMTNGALDPTKDWQFALFIGPDGFGGTQIGSTSSTLGDPDGILEFGGPALRLDTTYTICELGVAGGWTSFWQMDKGSGLATVVPYNPNADDTPPADLGNRCVDFIPAILNAEGQPTAPASVHFVVDNTYPGGDPRTPGYWKNWNMCTGGGQAAAAAANGGWEEGFWLLEDVLDPSIGGGIVWDDILPDDFVFNINSCRLAVSILDTRDFSTGKQMASDPGYNLAKHLLAAQLNLGAGACNTPEVLDTVLAAETLLDQVDFDAVGTGISKKDKTLAPLALQLAGLLDQYNNGMFCGSTYVP